MREPITIDERTKLQERLDQLCQGKRALEGAIRAIDLYVLHVGTCKKGCSPAALCARGTLLFIVASAQENSVCEMAWVLKETADRRFFDNEGSKAPWVDWSDELCEAWVRMNAKLCDECGRPMVPCPKGPGADEPGYVGFDPCVCSTKEETP